jgi:hypothetical protein
VYCGAVGIRDRNKALPQTDNVRSEANENSVTAGNR